MGQKLYYEPEKQDAEREINMLLTNACQEARDLIDAQRENTRTLAEALLIHDTLTSEQVLELLGMNKTQPAPVDVNVSADDEDKIPAFAT